eukprot:g4189.t1
MAMLVTMTIFGGAGVIAKLGMGPQTSPILFAIAREGSAAAILVALAGLRVRGGGVAGGGFLPPRATLGRFVVVGACLAVGQGLYIVGLKLAEPTTASIWQATQPVLTALIAIAIRIERFTWPKAAGILLGTGGAVFVGYFSSEAAAAAAAAATTGLGTVVIGNICFFLNCLGTSLYVILQKPLLARLPAVVVTAWGVVFAGLFLVLAGVATGVSPAAMALFNCTAPECEPWILPAGALPALAYWVLACSVLGYLLMNWANAHLEASTISAYTVVQPVAAALISWSIPRLDLAPRPSDLGLLAIAAGLFLLIFGDKVGLGGRAAT